MRRPSERGGDGVSTGEVAAGDGVSIGEGGSQPAAVIGQVVAFRESLPGTDLRGLSDGERLDLLHQIELLTRTLAAMSATVQVAFHASQVGAQVLAGVAPRRAGVAVPDDLATARMCSPYWGSRDLTAAKGLCEHLPRTFQALVAGVISPYQARLVAEGTTCVDPEHRAEIDERLEPRLPGISNRELEAAVRALVYEVDPAGFVTRARKAASDRGLSVRPAPDVMGILTARLPAPQAIAIYQCLDGAARARRASGDPRTVDQLRADELFERATGRRVVDGVDVEVGLVLTDAALFAGTSDPAELLGHGPVPADYARELLRPGLNNSDAERDRSGAGPEPRPSSTPEEAHGATDATFCPAGGACTDARCADVHGHPGSETSGSVRYGTETAGSVMSGIETFRSSSVSTGSGTSESVTPGSGMTDRARSRDTRPRPVAGGLRAASVWVRRLYTDPVTGVLVRRDPRRRFFADALRALVVARDRTCRSPWCGAPIRTVDHIRRHADGGPTDVDNGQGLCERCNLARERPRAVVPGPRNYLPAPPLLSAPPVSPDPPRRPAPSPRPAPPPPMVTLLPAPPVVPVFPRSRSARPDGGDRGDRGDRGGRGGRDGSDERDPDHPRA